MRKLKCSKNKKIKITRHPKCREGKGHEAPTKGKFTRKGTIKVVLKLAPDNELSIKG